MRRCGPMRDKRSKRADENKHLDYLEEDFDEEYNLFDIAKYSAEIEFSKLELILIRNTLLFELEKICQQTNKRGKLNLTYTEECIESIILWAGNTYKVAGFVCEVSRGIYDNNIKPQVWAYLYEFGNDEMYATQCYYSIKDIPELLKDVTDHLSKWI